MPKPPALPELPPETAESSFEESFYEVPADLQEGATARAEPSAAPPSPPPDDDELELRPSRRGAQALTVGLALGAVLLVLAAVVFYRNREKSRAVRDGLARAEQLIRRDTADGYREAANFYLKLQELNPSKGDALDVASARAFALAMLAADYHDAHAEAEANALLVVPGRAEAKPPRAALAFAALRLGTNTLGDATSELGYASEDDPWAKVLRARIALRAGTPEAAVEPAAAAAAVSAFAPGLAVHGDALRRARRDGASARAAYEAALVASPTQPRAVYGLAKLALSGHAPTSEATLALQRLAADGKTPAPERARAALHLTALALRAAAASPEAALDDPLLSLDPQARAWAARAAAAEAANKGPYKAVTGAPAGMESPSDDDPAELRPTAPPPPPPPPAAVVTPALPEPQAKPPPHVRLAKAGKTVAKATGSKAAKATAKPKAVTRSMAKAKATPAKKPPAKSKRKQQ
jgi:hypothetical protein